MKVALIVLEYNDAEETVKYVKKVSEYETINKIVVVDNHSTDVNTMEILKEIESEKVAVMQTEKNGGYSYGNNFGMKYLESLGEKYDLQDRIAKFYPKEIKRLEDKIVALENDVKHLAENTRLNENEFSTMVINDIKYNDKASAGQAILNACQNKKNADLEYIGNYRGFDLELEYNRFDKVFNLRIKNEYSDYYLPF